MAFDCTCPEGLYQLLVFSLSVRPLYCITAQHSCGKCLRFSLVIEALSGKIRYIVFILFGLGRHTKTSIFSGGDIWNYLCHARTQKEARLGIPESNLTRKDIYNPRYHACEQRAIEVCDFRW